MSIYSARKHFIINTTALDQLPMQQESADLFNRYSVGPTNKESLLFNRAIYRFKKNDIFKFII